MMLYKGTAAPMLRSTQDKTKVCNYLMEIKRVAQSHISLGYYEELGTQLQIKELDTVTLTVNSVTCKKLTTLICEKQ